MRVATSVVAALLCACGSGQTTSPSAVEQQPPTKASPTAAAPTAASVTPAGPAAGAPSDETVPAEPSSDEAPLVPFPAPRDVWILRNRLRATLPAGTTFSESQGHGTSDTEHAPIYSERTGELTTTFGGCSFRAEETDWMVPAQGFERAVRAVQIRLNGRAGRESHVERAPDAPAGMRITRVFATGDQGRSNARRALVYVGLPDSTIVLVTFQHVPEDHRRPPTFDEWRGFLRTFEGSLAYGHARPPGRRAHVPFGGLAHLELTLPEGMIVVAWSHNHGIDYSIARVMPMDQLPEAIYVSQGCSSMNAEGPEGCRPRGRSMSGTFGGRAVTWTIGRARGSRSLTFYDEDNDLDVTVTSSSAEGLAALRALAESARLIVDPEPSAE